MFYQLFTNEEIVGSVTGNFTVGYFAVGYFAVRKCRHKENSPQGNFSVRMIRRRKFRSTHILPYGNFAVKTNRRMEISSYGIFVVCLAKVLNRVEPFCTHGPN